MIRLADWNWIIEPAFGPKKESLVLYYRPNAQGGWTLVADTSLHDFLHTRPELEDSIALKYLRWFRVAARFEMELFVNSKGRYQVPGINN